MAVRLFIVVILCSSALVAQTPMKKLVSAFSGRWKIVDKADPSAQHPNGVVRTGEELWHTLGGGIPLIEEYHSKSSDGTEQYDTAAFWWDSTTQKYRGLFCATFVDQGCAPFDIEWHTGDQRPMGKDTRPTSETEKRDQIVISGEYLQNGKKYAWREVFVFDTPARFTQTLFLGQAGQPLRRAAIISATKIGDAR